MKLKILFKFAFFLESIGTIQVMLEKMDAGPSNNKRQLEEEELTPDALISQPFMKVQRKFGTRKVVRNIDDEMFCRICKEMFHYKKFESHRETCVRRNFPHLKKKLFD